MDSADAAPRSPCPAPANFRRAIDAYDREAEVGLFPGPRYRMTYRVLGQGPPLILIPGISSTYQAYALLLKVLGSKFRTIVYDYPGESPLDGAHLRRIRHDDLVDDLFLLIEHLRLGRIFPLGISFGSTITLKALHREPRRFPKAAVQGGFAYRRFTWAERVALACGRRIPGQLRALPFREQVLAMNNRPEFPTILADRWPIYIEDNARTPIAALAHRVDLLARLDLRPILPKIPSDVLLLQGNEDRIVPRRDYDQLCRGLPRAKGLILPLVGHIPHYTHAEAMASTLAEWFLPCAPAGCPREASPMASEGEAVPALPSLEPGR